jgi:hypothetical protein
MNQALNNNHVSKRCRQCNTGIDLNTGNNQRQPRNFPHKYWTDAIDPNCVVGGSARMTSSFGLQRRIFCPGGHRVGYFYPNSPHPHNYQFDNTAVY